MIAAFINFMAFCFGSLIYYLKKTSDLDYTDYDMDTVTASDFTVEFDIKEEMFKIFKSGW